MSDLSNLFYSNNDECTLHERLKISDSILEKGISRRKELRSYLRTQLKEIFDCDVKFLTQGSYKGHTLIKPPSKFDSYDFDEGVYLFFNAEEEDVSAKDVKDCLRDALESYVNINNECELQESKNSCEGLRYPNFLTIDTPIYYKDESSNAQMLATDSGWVDSDPMLLQKQLTHSFSEDKDRALMKRVVRYFKAWVNYIWHGSEHKKIPSLAINFLVSENLFIEKNDEESFLKTAIKIADLLSISFHVASPRDGANLLSMEVESEKYALEKIKNLHNKCLKCLDSTAYEKYIMYRGIFGHYFPSANISPDLEENVNFPAITTHPVVEVCRYSKSGKYIKSVYSDIDSVKAIKGEKLEFSIYNDYDFLPSDMVQWTVINTGIQSDQACDIGHVHNAKVDQEISRDCAYEGVHSMQFVIYRHGVVQGSSIIDVEIKLSKITRKKQRKV